MDQALDLIVTGGGDLKPGSIVRWLRPPSDDVVAQIDLRELNWTQPVGLVALAVFTESQAMLGRTVHLTSPQYVSAASYLSRMGIPDLVERFSGTHDLRPVNKNDMSNRLFELQPFESEDDVAQLAALVYDKTCARGEGNAAALHQSILEIGANVSEHSGRPHGYASAQTTHGGSVISFAIGDTGIGLAGSLADHGYEDEAAMLDAVMQGGISSTGQLGRGRGLKRARELLTAADGYLFAHSGHAARWERAGPARADTFSSGRVRGLVLQGTINC